MEGYVSILNEMEKGTVSDKLVSLRNMRQSIQSGASLLFDFDILSKFFTLLKPRFQETNADVLIQTILLMVDILKGASQTPEEDYDSYQTNPVESAIVTILPVWVTLLGFPQQNVRKAALDSFKTYLSEISNPSTFVSCLIKYGIENDDWKVRKECLAAFVKLITRDTGGFDQGHAVGALISRLRDMSDIVVQNSIHALAHLKSLIGEDNLLAHVKKLSGISRQIFKQHHSKIIQKDPINSGTIGRTDTRLTNNKNNLPDGNILSISGSTSHANLRNVTTNSEKKELSSSIENSKAKRSSSNLNLLPKSPKMSEKITLLNGYIPAYLITQLEHEDDWKIRASAIEKIHQLTLDITNPGILTDLPQLFYLLNGKLMNDSNFKIVLTSLHIIGQLVDICGSNALTLIDSICTNLILKLSDNKSIIRQAAVKILIKLMQYDVNQILNICMSSENNDNPRIKEEVVNLISTALLMFSKEDFEFQKLSEFIYFALKESKAKVKYVAMESFAIMADLISEESVFEILEGLGIDQETNHLLKLRFAEPMLPQLNLDGIIQHTISRSNAGTPSPSMVLAMSRETSKIFLNRNSSSKLVHDLNSAHQNTSVSINAPEIQANDLQKALKSINPLEEPIASLIDTNQTKPYSEKKYQTELKHARSFSNSETHNANRESQKNLVSPFQHIPPKGLQDIKELSISGSIYAPQLKSSSILVLPSMEADRDILQSTSNSTPKLASPFHTQSKLRRSPDIFGEHESGTREIDPIPDRFMDSQPRVTSPTKPQIKRSIKLTSAPPDRMRELEDENSFKANSDDEYGAKSSMAILSPKLSLATRRRIEAKNNQTAIASPLNQDREREKKLKMKKMAEVDFKEAFNLLKSNPEWNEASDALLVIQRSIPIRPDLISENMHELVLIICNNVSNIRSSVAKNGISCLNDMFIQFGKGMDTNLDLCASSLLKKIGESGFVSEEAAKCLTTMSKYVSNVRAASAIINSAEHKNPAVRLRISLLLWSLISSFTDLQASKYLQSVRDMEKLMPVLVKFLKEGLAETRNAAKKSVFYLSKYPEFEKISAKILSISQIKELHEAIDFMQHRGELTPFEELNTNDDPLDAALSPLAKPKNGIKKNSSPLKISKEQKIEEYESIFREMKSEDWKRKLAAIEDINNAICRAPQDFADRLILQRLFDVFLERCHDGNSKVSLIALDTLINIIPKMKMSLDPVVTLLVPVIVNQMVSASAPIKKSSSHSLDLLIENVDSLLILQSLSTIVQFGTNPKVKPLILEKLIGIVNSSYSSKPSAIIKYVLPVAVKLLKESKRDIKNVNDKLLISLHSHMGENLLLHTGVSTPSVRDRLATLEKAA